MSCSSLATLTVIAFGTCLIADEPDKLDGTLFLSQFHSLSTADVAGGSAEMKSEGVSLVPGRWGRGVRIRPGSHLAISPKGNLAPKQGTLMFWFKPNWRAVERRREAWLYGVLEQPYTPKRDARGRIQESRALLDEGCRWASRKGTEEVLDKMARAGFNVYIPCIWHGRGARWPSKRTPMETVVERILGEEAAGFDPLENLVRSAHARGIEVHPWFCVCYGDPTWKPLAPFIEKGTPRGACEAHAPAFRKFTVELMLEVVKRYDVDGLNLDYIRTKGISTSATARASYRKRFGTELLDDIKKPGPNGWPNPSIVRWQNEAIAQIVRSISQRARAARPNLVISVDGHPCLPTDKPGTQGRDGFWWAQEGWIDVIYSMDYSRRLSWQKTDAIRAALKRPAAAGIIAGNYERTEKGGVMPREGQLVADLIGFCQRKYPGNGVALYWYGSLDDAQIKALRAGPFREPAQPYWLRASRDCGPGGRAANANPRSATPTGCARVVP